jgi:hypothetical protein
MTRIIIEDMKFNKKKDIIHKKNVDISSHVLDTKNKEIIYEKEVEKVQEEKINEYFKIKELEKHRVERIGRTPRERSKPRIIHRSTLVIFIICVISGSIYWGGNIFHKADINVTLKHQIINYKNKEFIALKEDVGNPINFEIMMISDKKTKSLILTDTKEVSLKAKGSITIYNEFSNIPQKIEIGSFITDLDGKAYKTDKTIIIPGYKLDTEKKIIAGQIDVGITSFLPGDSYNSKQLDFYVSSFKGTPKYNKIYGKLKTDISGGAEGLVYILNDENKKMMENILKSSLKDDLYNQVKAEIPPGYLLYKDALTFSYNIDENVLSKTPDAKIDVEGFLSVVLLKEKSLIDNIIKTSLPNIKGDELKEITLPDINELSFSFVDKDQTITKDMEKVSFTLNGEIDAIWNPDMDLLKGKLVGVEKGSVGSIFKEDPGIASAVVKISPFWKKNISKDLSRINIIIK